MIHQPHDEGWLEHPFRQAPWRTQTQGTSLVMAAVVMVAVIGALYLAQSSRTAAAGRRLQELEEQRQLLEQQNAQLGAEIAALRSVPRLIREAEAMGYHPARANEVEYLVVHGVAPPPEQDVIVRARQPEQPPEEQAAPVAEYDETLQGWLSDRFGEFSVQFAVFWQTTFSRPEAGETPEQP